MYQIDNATAATSQPASTAAGTSGFFTDGNPATSTPATVVPAEWLNAVMMELVNVVTGAGLTPTKNQFNQVALAVKTLIQNQGFNYGGDAGSANAYAVAYTPAVTSVFDGLRLRFKATNANTGASTFCPAPGTIVASPLWGANHSALQGGEISPNSDVEVVWNSSLNSGAGAWVLLENTGGALQVSPATKSSHAPQISQVASALGAVNTKVYTAAASSFTLTADRVVAATALAGGIAYVTSGFSKTINLATTGAGGMDTGSAPTSGYVAIYAIYNPTSNTWALLATNATSAAVPEVYSGANMPSGYTASCLVSVWGTTSTANQFRAGLQRGRNITFVAVVCLNTSTTQASYTSLSISSTVPPNATTVYGSANPQSSAASTLQVHIAGDGAGVGDNYIVATSSSTGSVGTSGVFRAAMSAAQTIYYQWSNTGGTPQLGINVSGYDF